MELFEMLESIKQLPLLQLQEYGKDFLGAIINNEVLKEIENILGAFFGPPLKDTNAVITKKMLDISDPYGGIRQGQVLYYKEHNDSSKILAMLWPWSDNKRLTLKIIQQLPTE